MPTYELARLRELLAVIEDHDMEKNKSDLKGQHTSRDADLSLANIECYGQDDRLWFEILVGL